MARPLTFMHRGAELPLTIEKLERGKLYGSVAVEALDERGQKCELATLSTDGRTLIGRGGTATGFLSPEGRWVERSSLKPVDLDGADLAEVPSSFKETIPLDKTATVEEYLSHNIKSVYLLDGEQLGALAEELKSGTIYTFPFSFRGGIVADVGFLLAGQDDAPFMAVGQPTQLHFLGLEQLPLYEDETPDEGADDDLDMNML